jgi:acetylornithine deacetylase/succinyl-diaminopimelate desuccinylase-like protein
MRSGAAHDAAIMSDIAPTGMVLVPSREGLSHAADEWSDAQDIALGAAILATTIAAIGAKLASSEAARSGVEACS